MNQRPLALLYPTAALTFAALIYMTIRREAEIDALRTDLDDQRQRLHDLEEYIRPLREYSNNRAKTL